MKNWLSELGKKVSLFFGLLLWVVSIVSPSLAHEVIPTIANFHVQENQLTLTLRINAEAVVAGIDLDGLENTDATERSFDYDFLRGLSAQELGPMTRLALEDWLPDLVETREKIVPVSVSHVEVPAIGDLSIPRETEVTVVAELDPRSRSMRVNWPTGGGMLVLRQNDVAEPYTGYLKGGESSPFIPLAGGAAQTSWEVFKNYIPVGFEHILPLGLDHILFVLGLFFLSTRLRVLIWQISAFTLAHTVTLALGATQAISVNPSIVEPLIAASIVFVAVENIFVRQLHSWRTFVVFCFGLLHGLGFATVLGEFGLPEAGFIPALVGFNIGVELGQLTVIAGAYCLLGFWFGRHPKYRGRVAIPASTTIAGIGAYWFFERLAAVL